MRLFDSSYLKLWDNLNLPFHLSLFIEMPSLKRNETVAWLEFGREHTRLHASRHRRSCGVLKSSNCIFYTYSTEEFTNHIKKKHSSCQHKVKLCAQQSQNSLQEKVKLISFLSNNFTENTNTISINLKNFSRKITVFYHDS